MGEKNIKVPACSGYNEPYIWRLDVS